VKKKKVTVKPIGNTTWQFTEQYLGENVYCYLLAGTEKALLIDTGYGFTDIPGTIKELTDKPLILINTHGHFDHISGNYRFGKTFLSEKDEELYRLHSRRDTIEAILSEAVGGGIKGKAAILALRPSLSRIYSNPFPDTQPLPECGCFELGNRLVKILETPGHTQGSVSLLDVKNGWLFSGDTCGDAGMLLHFPESSSVRTFHKTIRNILGLVNSGAVTRNYPAHQTSPAPLEKLKNYDILLDRLERGSISQAEWAKSLVEQGGVKIQFDPRRVREEIV
jgi:hydroxyacylglutathione hydrolase